MSEKIRNDLKKIQDEIASHKAKLGAFDTRVKDLRGAVAKAQSRLQTPSPGRARVKKSSPV